MPRTVTDLGQMVKAKYPGIYDDLPDDQLGVKVQAKFPGAYDDFINSSTWQQGPRQQPGILDRISTEMNQGGAVLDPGSVVNGIGSSLGRTTQAWSEFLTGKGISPSMVPLVGPMAQDAAQKLFTPGQRVEGATDVGMMLAPAAGNIPSVPESTLPILKAAAKEAGRSAVESVPIGAGTIGKFFGVPQANVPAIIARPLQGAAGGGILSREIGMGAEPGAIAGGITGTVVPLIRGAIKGGKAELAAQRAAALREQSLSRVPGWSDIPGVTPPSPPSLDVTPATTSITGRRPGGIQNQVTPAPVVRPPAAPTVRPGYPAGVDPDVLDGLAQSYTGNPRATYLKLKGPQQTAAINTARGLAQPPGTVLPAQTPVPTIQPIAGGSAPITASTEDLTGSLPKHLVDRTAKIHNIYDYLATQRPDLNPDAIEKMSDADGLKLVKQASDWARTQGRSEGALANPKGAYRSFNMEETDPNTGNVVPGTKAEVLNMLRGGAPPPAHPRSMFPHYGAAPSSPWVPSITPLVIK